MSAATPPTLCKLQIALGEVEACSGDSCPFWEPGGPGREGRCTAEQVDLTGRPETAAWLLRIRQQLETAGTREEDDEARRRFYRLVNTGDADGG